MIPSSGEVPPIRVRVRVRVMIPSSGEVPLAFKKD